MSRRLVVFPERRTVRMAEHICSVHGGVLPVPENFGENKVRGWRYTEFRSKFHGNPWGTTGPMGTFPGLFVPERHGGEK